MPDGLDWVSFTAQEAYQFGPLPLMVWREARNQPFDAKLAVAWVARNRVFHARWWGWDYPSVILRNYKGVSQFSSFDEDDVQSNLFPKGHEPAFVECLSAALNAFKGTMPDPTVGATHYFDNSLDPGPGKSDRRPSWALRGPLVHTVDIGAFHFFR